MTGPASVGTIGIWAVDPDGRQVVWPLIPSGTQLPARFCGVVGRGFPGQGAVELQLTLGEGPLRGDVAIVGVIRLVGLEPRAPLELTLDHLGHEVRCELVAVGSGVRSELVVSLP